MPDEDEEKDEDEVELAVEREVEPPLEEVRDPKPSTSTTPTLSLPFKFAITITPTLPSNHPRQSAPPRNINRSPPPPSNCFLHSTLPLSLRYFPFVSPLSPPFASLSFRDFLT